MAFTQVLRLLPHFIMACDKIVPPRESFVAILSEIVTQYALTPYPDLVFTVSLSDIVVSISLCLVCVPPPLPVLSTASNYYAVTGLPQTLSKYLVSNCEPHSLLTHSEK